MANRKLTDTQLVILSAAAGREGGSVLPLPKSVRVNRGTQTIVLRGLLTKELIEERPAQPGDEVWETAEDGSRTTLVITDAGLAAVGIDPGPDNIAPGTDGAGEVATEPKPRKGKAAAGSAVPKKPKAGPAAKSKSPAAGSDRAALGTSDRPAAAKSAKAAKAVDRTVPAEPGKDTKLGILIAALRRKKGATMDEMMEATGWQAHSVRGAISGALKKKLQLEVVSETTDSRGRVYRIGGDAA